MDEILIDSEIETNVEIEPEEIIENAEEETSEQNIDIEDEHPLVEVEPIEEMDIEVDEATGWAGGDNTWHGSLSGRDEANQHPISAISGLEDELNKINALKTVESDRNGVANYYEWSDAAHDEFGYFVSLVPHSDTITICDGLDIFGVTVDEAGFVGRQDEDAPRNNRYGLVMNSGVVSVRCESDVEEGDYVTSNAYGVAAKTDSLCGYKVISRTDVAGVEYAVIVLGVQACTTDLLSKDIQHLEGRMDNAEINIAAAMSTANEAYKKAEETLSSNKDMSGQIEDIVDKVDKAESDVGDLGGQVSDIATIAATAREVANSAATSAESMRLEAVEEAEKALSKAGEIEKSVEPIAKWQDPVSGNTGATYYVEYIENGLSTKAEMETVNTLDAENKLLIEQNAQNYMRMLSSVDKYTIGEHSQAYGLTLQQAKNILKEGMVYIPLSYNGENTHTETYANGDDTVERTFTYGFYYVWSGDSLWSEQATGQVWFGETQPAGDAYTYWYHDNILYLLNNGTWTEVATLVGNASNRLTSMIRQNMSEITADVTNARGSSASLSARLNDTDAVIASNAFWKNDNGSEYVAAFEQRAGGDGSSLALIAKRIDTTNGTEEDKSVELKGASIVLGQNASDSYININAQNIVLDGGVAFTKDENGVTKIDGANIATGTVTADQIDATGIQATGVDISGKITATEGKIGGWTIAENQLWSQSGGEGVATYKFTGYPTTSLSAQTVKFKAKDGITYYGIRAVSMGTDAYNVEYKTSNTGDSWTEVFNGTGMTWVSNTNTISFLEEPSSELVTWILEYGQLSSETSAKCSGIFTGQNKVWSLVNSGEQSDVRFFAGSEQRAGTITRSGCPFIVLEDGSLYASAAQISGKITATSGEIGGCEISDGVLQVDAAKITSVDAAKITVGVLDLARIPVLNADKINAENLEVKAANVTGQFNTSKIDTEGLKVGKWTIQGDALTGTTDNYTISGVTYHDQVKLQPNSLSVTHTEVGGTSATESVGWYYILKAAQTTRNTYALSANDAISVQSVASNSSELEQQVAELKATTKSLSAKIEELEKKINSMS